MFRSCVGRRTRACFDPVLVEGLEHVSRHVHHVMMARFCSQAVAHILSAKTPTCSKPASAYVACTSGDCASILSLSLSLTHSLTHARTFAESLEKYVAEGRQGHKPMELLHLSACLSKCSLTACCERACASHAQRMEPRGACCGCLLAPDGTESGHVVTIAIRTALACHLNQKSMSPQHFGACMRADVSMAHCYIRTGLKRL
jgi:hypothetical protein